jgi:energy-coupling factor transporter ATP-binding protein EcfA2
VLPELVLVGDQSAGKSTLLGAIAGINLPRSDGMCTRCPANIKTSPAATWSCTVSLEENYSYVFGGGKRKAGQEDMPSFPNWEPKGDGRKTKKLFKTIVNKSELENVIRLAQAALMSPDQDSDSFLPGSGINASSVLTGGYESKTDFSPNVVTIEISGPLLPSLSLYDLPGNFVNAKNRGEDPLIEVFKKLSESYIVSLRAQVSCSGLLGKFADYCFKLEAQECLDYLRHVDAHRRRTIMD